MIASIACENSSIEATSERCSKKFGFIAVGLASRFRFGLVKFEMRKLININFGSF
jgi:hypothetical protein